MTKNDMEKDYIYSNAKLHYTIVSGNSDEPFVLIPAELFEEKMQKLMEYASMKADETDL